MSREQQVRDALARFLSQLRKTTDTNFEILTTDLIAILRGDLAQNDEAPARLVAAIRRLDAASTLRGVLDALAAGAADHAARSVVLLVEQGVARVYRHQGFAAERQPVEVAAGSSATLASAIVSQGMVLVHPGDDPRGPAFVRVPTANMGIAMPIVVALQVVAVIYAEGPENQTAGDSSAPGWTSLVEALARHAAARLENVTSKRTVEVLSGR